MISHAILFGTAAAVFVSLLLGVAGVSVRRARRVMQEPGLNVFLERLTEIDRHKIALVAHDFTNDAPRKGEALESWQVWELVGGMEGIEALAANCEVLIDLACHVQRWYPEALPVAEQLRLNAREIQWHVERLKGAQRRGNLQTAFPDYAQRAVAIYYGMTRHVLALYEATQTPGLSELQTAL